MYRAEINIQQLLERLNYSMTKKEVLRLAIAFTDEKLDLELLISRSCYEDSALAFHSAWVLENIMFQKEDALDYYLPRFIDLLPRVKSPSVRRHFAKLIAMGIRRVVEKKASKACERELWITDLEPLEEVCFRWFVEEDTRPAVKAHCLEILYLLSTREKWIAEELPTIIENQMVYGSPGLKAKGRAILKLLR
jgi:hypothetical protein